MYRSVDGGATFTEWGTPLAGSNPTWVQEDPFVENSVFVLAGRYMKHSTAPSAPGTSWAILFTGPENAVARTMIRGKSGALTWVAFTGTFSGSPLQRVEGSVPAIFPALSPVVSQIRALALDDSDTPTLYAWDSEGRCFAVDAEAGGVVQRVNGNLAAGETAQHAVHDLNQPIVYLATFGASQGSVKKYLTVIDRLLTFRAGASGQQAHMVGLASKFTRVNARIVAGSWGGTGANALMYYDPDLGWVGRGAGLPSGWYWYRVVANPFNPAEWVAYGQPSVASNQWQTSLSEFETPIVNDRLEVNGQSPVWRTTDAGATWSQVWITMPADHASPAPYAADLTRHTFLDFSPAAAGRLIMAFLYPVGPSAYNQNMRVGIVDAPIAAAMTATGMPLTPGATTNGANAKIFGFAVGERGDVVVSLWASHWPAMIATKAQGESVWAATVSVSVGNMNGFPDTLALSRALVLPTSYTPDYRANPFGAGAWPSQITGTPGYAANPTLIAALADETYHVAVSSGNLGSDYTFWKITNPITSPVATKTRDTTYFYDGVKWMRAGRQTRRALAARTGDRFNDGGNNNLTLVYDGVAWANLPGPAGVTLSYGIEVLDYE